MGERMRSTDIKTRVLPSLVAGTGRRPIDLPHLFAGAPAGSPDVARRQALSLAGQFLRFERPGSPGRLVSDPVVRDERRILPDALRRPLIRLLTISKASEPIALAIAAAIDRLNLRLHPFDLPRLSSFVETWAPYLGPSAEQWTLSQTESAPIANSFYGEEHLDDKTWHLAAPRRKVEYINRRRREDAGAARDLVAATWAQQDPDLRIKLLTIFEISLSSDDQSFLEERLKERSPRVKALAGRLLGRLGSAYENPALAQCMERIRREEKGVLRKRVALALELPANVKENAAPSWIRELFSDVGWIEFARGLKMTETEVIEASAKSSDLLLGLAWMATMDARFDLLETVCQHYPEVWERMSAGGRLDLAHLSREKRAQWAESLTRPVCKKPPMDYIAWKWLHATVQGTLPAELMKGMLRSGWRTELEDRQKAKPDWPELLAASAPPELRDDLREQLRDVDPTLTANAISLMEVLDNMERF